MGNWTSWWLRKFYRTQVTLLLADLERFFKNDIDLDKYLKVCEQLGQEPDPNKMPPSRGELPYEVQIAFSIHDMLPDRWDGMSGSYFGKDLSALGTIIDIYEVEDKKQCVFWLKNIEALNSRSINDRMAQERKRKK